MTGAGQIPVYRSSSQAADSLRAAEQALRDGECVIIYPEGTITVDPDYLADAGQDRGGSAGAGLP